MDFEPSAWARDYHAWVRAMRIFDGPDEVHVRTVARQELRRHGGQTDLT
jgi:alkylation response protein AidB-like acyl-CoA dehydrogenase